MPILANRWAPLHIWVGKNVQAWLIYNPDVHMFRPNKCFIKNIDFFWGGGRGGLQLPGVPASTVATSNLARGRGAQHINEPPSPDYHHHQHAPTHASQYTVMTYIEGELRHVCHVPRRHAHTVKPPCVIVHPVLFLSIPKLILELPAVSTPCVPPLPRPRDVAAEQWSV